MKNSKLRFNFFKHIAVHELTKTFTMVPRYHRYHSQVRLCRSWIQCTSCCTFLALTLVTGTAEYLLADRRPGWKVKLVQVLDPVHKLLHFLSTDSGDSYS